MTNRRSRSSGVIENIAPAAGRNTKSSAETALVSTPVSTGPWHS